MADRGGESGRGYRPRNFDWVRDIRDPCDDLGVHFLFQPGRWNQIPVAVCSTGAPGTRCLRRAAMIQGRLSSAIRRRVASRTAAFGRTGPLVRGAARLTAYADTQWPGLFIARQTQCGVPVAQLTGFADTLLVIIRP
ncbi:DUF5131 family protein [Nocardia sp. CA-129566]|uniref:DUF5131 family protein n=1 Tax=Nocardia sp. CA-129566 TaxID=3239976 RepID=UPI003D998333